MMCGYDLDLMEKISTICKVPVIASGGAGSYGNIVDVVKKLKFQLLQQQAFSFYSTYSCRSQESSKRCRRQCEREL